MSARDLDTLQSRSELILPPLRGVRSVHFAVFASRGLQEEAARDRIEGGEATHFDADELFVFES